MYCTRCKKEFGDETSICPDCKSELVDNPIDDIEVVEAMKPVKVASAANSVEAGIIMNLLNTNGIQCFKKDNGIGGYMNIYCNFSIYGEEIYVDESDYEKASTIVKELTPELMNENTGNNEPDNNDEPDNNEDADNNEEGDDPYTDYPFYRNPRTLARIYIIGSIIIGVLIYIINKIINH